MASDRELKRLQRARDLDRKTLAAIYDDYQPLVYGFIYRRTGDIEVARDLTAEVFRRFLQALQQRNGPTDSLRAWFYRVAHNIVVDHYRRQQFRDHLPLNEGILGAGESPDQAAERQLLAEQVRAALTQLTTDQQQVINLKFLEGLTNKEVAEILGKPIGAVKSLQHRALAALQRELVQVEEEVLA